MNFMSVRWEVWLGWCWGYVGDRKGWAQILVVERLVGKDAGLVFAFSPSPAPQRGGNWRRLRRRDVHLRGKVLCVGTGWGSGRTHA